MKRTNFVFLLCLMAVSEVKIHGQHEIMGNKNKKTKIVVTCDSFENITDFTVPQNVESVQNHVFFNLWNITLAGKSALVDELESVLEDMAMKSKVPFWRRYALASTELIFAYVSSYIEVPQLCAYAQIINATVEYKKTGNCPVILNAVQAATVAFTEAGYLLTENGIKYAGCEHCTRPITLSTSTCPQKGLVYEFEDMWTLIGWEYPCRLRTIVKKMYYSNNILDRKMALLVTAPLSKYLSIMEREYEPEPLYKIFVMYTNGKVNRYCCDDYVHEARTLSDKIQELNVEIFSLARKSTGCVGN